MLRENGEPASTNSSGAGGLAVGNAGDEATAIARLRAMRCVQLDRGEEGAERLLNAVQFTLTGTPEDVVAILCLFLEGHLGKDVSAQELLDHLTTRGLRPRDLARDPSLPSALLELREEFFGAPCATVWSRGHG